jgi:nitrite reductase/ring-hydroxylating ferredoxin subunit
MAEDPRLICESAALPEEGRGVRFEVDYFGGLTPAFVIRKDGVVHGYLNRCAHVAMELDWQPNRFFDETGRWLTCGTHGAVYRPDTGDCAGGPCGGGLVKIAVAERDGMVRWHTGYNLKPVEF